MTCPYYQGEMKPGYIRTYRDPLVWTPEGKKKRWYMPYAYVSDFEVALDAWGWRGSRIDALYCDICKKVVIDVPG